MRGKCKPKDCSCDDNFTCGVCLRNTPVYLYTPLTTAEIIFKDYETYYKNQLNIKIFLNHFFTALSKVGEKTEQDKRDSNFFYKLETD